MTRPWSLVGCCLSSHAGDGYKLYAIPQERVECILGYLEKQVIDIYESKGE